MSFLRSRSDLLKASLTFCGPIGTDNGSIRETPMARPLQHVFGRQPAKISEARRSISRRQWSCRIRSFAPTMASLIELR